MDISISEMVAHRLWSAVPDHVMTVSGGLTFEVLHDAFEMFGRNTRGHLPEIVLLSPKSYEELLESPRFSRKDHLLMTTRFGTVVRRYISDGKVHKVDTLCTGVLLHSRDHVVKKSFSMVETTLSYFLRIDLHYILEQDLLRNACKRRRW